MTKDEAASPVAATTGAPAPLPWRVHRFGPWEAVVDANYRPLFGLMTVPEPNWHFICLAVNQHHALVAALKEARAAVQIVMRWAPGYDWNADPEHLTLVVGDSYKRIGAVLAQCEPRAQP